MADPILHLSLPVDDLAAARRFYEGALGCRVGRVRDRWFDVWFFGLQLTLALRPDEVRGAEDQGARHFGVVLDDAESFDELVERLRAHSIGWLSEPTAHAAAELSGKVGGKLADPAGNVIEIKYYADPTEFIDGSEAGGIGKRFFNHVGICVSDRDRSRAFYEGALGFTHTYDLSVPDGTASMLLRVPRPVGMTAVYLQREGLIIELLHFDRDENAQRRDRPFTEPGLTHLSLTVEDLEAACASVVEHGGEVLDDTLIPGVVVMVRDPDGQALELIARP